MGMSFLKYLPLVAEWDTQMLDAAEGLTYLHQEDMVT